MMEIFLKKCLVFEENRASITGSAVAADLSRGWKAGEQVLVAQSRVGQVSAAQSRAGGRWRRFSAGQADVAGFWILAGAAQRSRLNWVEWSSLGADHYGKPTVGQ